MNKGGVKTKIQKRAQMRWKDSKYQNYLEIQMDGLFHDATLRPIRFYNFDTVGSWSTIIVF